MLSYCLNCRKIQNDKDFENKTKQRKNNKQTKTNDLLKFVVYGSKKSRFIKGQEAEGLLSMINNITVLGPSLL